MNPNPGTPIDIEEPVLQEALRWHATLAAGDCDWGQFTLWLEAAAVHRQAFDEVALLDDQVAQHRAALQRAFTATEPVVPLRPYVRQLRRVRPWLGAALAAGIVAVTVLVLRPPQPAMPLAALDYVADAATGRTVELGDGVRVELAPGSRLQVSGADRNALQLDGAAYFDVHHDPRRTLHIAAGDFRIRDIGTRFEVTHGLHALKVAVAEGAVSVALPDGAPPLQVRAGQRLLVAGQSPRAEYAAIAEDDVAGWRVGRLSFQNEPLSMVAAQLSRYAGVTVRAEPAVADRRFSGVLTIGDGSQLVAGLAQIMDLSSRQEGHTVYLSADPRH